MAMRAPVPFPVPWTSLLGPFCSAWQSAPPVDAASAKHRRRQGRYALARKVETYLEANLRNPVTILGLANELGVNRRTVELVFQEIFRISPYQYLLNRRLHGARDDLLKGGTARRIMEIAYAWGFTHAGRFSAKYKVFFGELPSRTLRKAGESGGKRENQRVS